MRELDAALAEFDPRELAEARRMERGYGDDETKAFLASLTISDEGQIDLNELKQAFEKIFN